MSSLLFTVVVLSLALVLTIFRLWTALKKYCLSSVDSNLASELGNLKKRAVIVFLN